MTIAIVGLGLIGGSLALNFYKNHTVWGCDADEGAVSYCLEKGMIHAKKDVSALGGADVVFVCVPVFRVAEVVDRVYAAVGDSAVITDVGSVKRNLAGKSGRLVGGHPMSGTEFSGCRAAKAELFKGNFYFVSGYNAAEADILCVEGLIEQLGSKPLRIDAERHDELVARLSHLPHMAAYALAQCAITGDRDFTAGSGFMSTSRVAGSDADFWAGVAALNADNLLRQLRAYRTEIERLEGFIQGGDFTALHDYLETARLKRERLITEINKTEDKQ